MSKGYKGWSLFNDVEDPIIRTWNRCATIYNIKKSEGAEVVEGYMKNLDDKAKEQVLAMLRYIRKFGYETSRRNIFGKLRAVQ